MDPEPLFESNNSIIIQVTNLDQNGSFSTLVQGLTGEDKYFYRAYSKNAEGVGYGSVYDFTTLETAQGLSWAQAPCRCSRWWTSPWLGAFYLMIQRAGSCIRKWVVFPMEVPGKGVWLWHASLGWIWTDESLYPFLYGNRDGGWLYFYGSQNRQSLFYNYATGKWMALNTSEK